MVLVEVPGKAIQSMWWWCKENNENAVVAGGGGGKKKNVGVGVVGGVVVERKQ